MTDADVLEIAARQAEFQPGASGAIRAAVSFLDRYPGALSAAMAATGDSRPISLALVLGPRFTRSNDVARFFRQAARSGEQS